MKYERMREKKEDVVYPVRPLPPEQTKKQEKRKKNHQINEQKRNKEQKHSNTEQRTKNKDEKSKTRPLREKNVHTYHTNFSLQCTSTSPHIVYIPSYRFNKKAAKTQEQRDDSHQ